jgi:hypothetical protein
MSSSSDTDFYITLPSNSGMTEYPTNRPSKFKVNLARKHDLSDGEWEIGLVEIQFTNNWGYKTPAFDMVVWAGNFSRDPLLYRKRPDNYIMSDSEMRLLDVGELDYSLPLMVTSFLHIPASNWINEYEFGAWLTTRIKHALDDRLRGIFPTKYDADHRLDTIRYVRDSVARRVLFESANPHQFIGITTENDDVMSILGFAPRVENERLHAGKKTRAYGFGVATERQLGGFLGMQTMYVYSGVAEEQLIGDQVGNLLNVVPVTVPQGGRQCERYTTPRYCRIRPNTLTSIDIELRDGYGNEVEFSDTKSFVVVSLHVRKRSQSARTLGWC